MSDRFRFRVWDKQRRDFIYDAEMANECNDKRVDCFGDYLGDWSENWIVEQCTGLKDKNGKLIYEGDIVQYIVITHCEDTTYHEKGVVRWHDGEFWPLPKEYVEEDPWYTRNIIDYNILGNIHQNPELLSP